MGLWALRDEEHLSVFAQCQIVVRALAQRRLPAFARENCAKAPGCGELLAGGHDYCVVALGASARCGCLTTRTSAPRSGQTSHWALLAAIVPAAS
jgi:hypothetical protein